MTGQFGTGEVGLNTWEVEQEQLDMSETHKGNWG